MRALKDSHTFKQFDQANFLCSNSLGNGERTFSVIAVIASATVVWINSPRIALCGINYLDDVQKDISKVFNIEASLCESKRQFKIPSK